MRKIKTFPDAWPNKLHNIMNLIFISLKSKFQFILFLHIAQYFWIVCLQLSSRTDG